MKKVVLVISCLILLASVGVVGMSCDDDDDTVTWRLANYSMDGTLQTDMLNKFIDKVEEKSNGDLEIEMWSGGSLYKLTQIFGAVSDGSIDLGYCGVTAYFSDMPKTASVYTYMSVVADDLEQLNELAHTLTDDLDILVQDASDNNISHLLFGPLGTTGCFYKEPVEVLADMKDMVVGCTSGVTPIAQMMGCSPKVMEFANAYQDAYSGLIEGWILAPLTDYVQMSLYEVLPYAVDPQLPTSMSVLMNQDSFDALSEDLQEAVLKAASETESEWIQAVAQADEDSAQAIIDEPDAHYYKLPETERANWYEIALVPVFKGIMLNYLDETEIADVEAIIAGVKES